MKTECLYQHHYTEESMNAEEEKLLSPEAQDRREVSSPAHCPQCNGGAPSIKRSTSVALITASSVLAALASIFAMVQWAWGLWGPHDPTLALYCEMPLGISSACLITVPRQ
jgi:hypothetical protein